MARLNITLDQEEVLQLLTEDSSNAFKTLLEKTLNQVLKAESTEQLKAQPYERNTERTDSRNGIRIRPLTTRIGTIELTVPRHRNIPFKTLVFQNYKRSEAALVTTMAEMVVAGVSTAKVGRVMEEICGKSFSKQAVSEACKELDDAVSEFSNRRIEGNYLFVMVDATYLKVRQDHRIASKALLVAMGLNSEGHKEIIGFSLADAETKESWTEFLRSLKARGLSGMKMFTSDTHEGIVCALQDVFPDVAWQRCQAHFVRNIIDATPKRLKEGLRSELIEMFNSSNIRQARKRRDEIISDYSIEAPKAMECLDAGFDDAMTVMQLPKEMRRCTRTSNYLERLNREIKRRTKVISIFPNASSVNRLVGSFLIEENDRWALKGKLYYSPACRKLEQQIPELIKIARIQKQLRKAA